MKSHAAANFLVKEPGCVTLQANSFEAPWKVRVIVYC